jgi:hypothetical protein
MSKRISFRLDAEDERKLRAMAKQGNTTMRAILKEAIREAGKRLPKEPGTPTPSAWEVYQELYHLLPVPKEGQPLHDRARHVRRIIKEKLLAKR